MPAGSKNISRTNFLRRCGAVVVGDVVYRPKGRCGPREQPDYQLVVLHSGEVDLKVDALGGRKFAGKVTQVGGATGSRLSLFPPENATGNYVKVVQRIPVRIDFTNLDKDNKDFALRPGFSVTPEVSVKGAGDYKDSGDCEKGLPEHQ